MAALVATDREAEVGLTVVEVVPNIGGRVGWWW